MLTTQSTPKAVTGVETAKKKKRGRPVSSRDVKVTPEFRETPDIEKLARALIAVAISIAQKKEAEEKAAKVLLEDGKGDVMT